MIRLRILGSTELHDADGRELGAVLAQPKRLALLAYLAASRGFHRRDTLLAMFWPELDSARGREALNQAVRFLRKELGGSTGSLIISRGAAELGVESGSLWCDAAAFRDHIDAKRYGEALDLYRGDLLPGFFSTQAGGFEEWLDGERTRLRVAAARAAREVAEAREREHSFTTAVISARRAVELAGLDERIVRDLLALLDRLGDRAGALHAYEEFARRLSDELETEPAAETKAVMDQIRKREATGRLVGSESRLPASLAVERVSADPAPGTPDTARLAEAVAPIRLTSDRELNGWRIMRELGRGGMATVHMALDVKHDRYVALKVLRPELATRVGADRFLREIQITAQLAHPHILPLIDSGACDGLPYLVTPYVAGETLRARLDRETKLPVDDALRLAREIAEALDYAHRCGIIHRDIKPENVLLADGHAMVTDFGIARALAATDPPPDGTATASGLVIGSPAYMSPEALEGGAVGVQTDIYALGCVLVEMLTGALPIRGVTHLSLVRRQGLDPNVAKLAVECIAAVPERRPQTAADLVRRLELVSHGTNHDGRRSPWSILGIARVQRAVDEALARVPAEALATAKQTAGGVVALAALVAGVGWWRATHAAPPAPTRFTIEPPAGLWINDNANGFNLALSPDGQSLAFFAGPQRQLYVRHLDQLEPIPLPKTSGAADIHFSADGKWLAYMAQMDSGGPTKIPVGPGDVGAKPTKLSITPGWSGMTWSSSPDVVYSWADTLWRVPAGGGRPRMVAGMDPTVDGRWQQPTMMPDGKTLAFVVSPRGAVSRDADRLAFISIGGGPRTLLDLPSQSALGYVDGALIFSRFSLGPARIMAVRFDLARRKLLGEPVTLMDGVPVKGGAGALAVVADNGTLAYLGRTAGSGMIQIVDERGAVVGGLPELVGAEQMVWSPDGQHIAMFSVEDDKPDIWVYDVTSRARKQITRTGGWLPAWTPDGTRIGFIEWSSGGARGGKAMWVSADGSELPAPIPGTSSLGSSIAQVSFTSDGKYAVVRTQVRSGEPAETPHVLSVPLAGGPPLPTGVGGRVPSSLAVSPDGQWIAYAWNKAGRTDVYVSPFLGRRGEMQLSTDGGSQPRWSADGRKLFYRSGRGKNILRVATLDLRGARPRLVRSDSLVFEPSHSDPTIVSYAVHPDGKRFLVARNAGETKLFVVTNWMTEVRAKLAGK